MSQKWSAVSILILVAVFASNAVAAAAPARVSLSSNRNPATYGQYVTLRALVTPEAKGGGTPTGTVSFVDGSSTLGVVSLNAEGIASLKTNSLAGGEHLVRATYGGDGAYAPAESAPLAQRVNQAAVDLTLESALDPASFGAQGNLTATITGLPTGGAAAGGSVTFFDGGTALATVAVAGSSAQYPLHGLAPGIHAISAAYSGDVNYRPAGAEPFSQEITKATTEVAMKSSANPALQGSANRITATIGVVRPGTTEGGSPTGTVTFFEDGTPVAQVQVVHRIAKYSIGGSTAGTHEFRAAYGGDGNFEPSVSAPFSQAIVLPPGLTSISPGSGPEAGGTTVLIEGVNLAGATAVEFGGKPAQRFEVRTPTLVEAVSPAASGTVDVTVTTPGGTTAISGADRFTYLPPHPVDAYWNYYPVSVGRPMCRGNPARPESMPGGTLTQTFTVPSEVAALETAVVQIDPDTSVTAHLTLFVDGIPRAEAAAAAVGDTHFSWPSVPVSAGDQVALRVSFTATFGKIITIYSAAAVGGTLTFVNTCSDGAPSGSSEAGLRAIVSGMSP